MSALTARQVEVLQLTANTGGYGATRRIAAKYGISPRTAKSHFREIRLRLRARNITHAVAIAWSRGLIK